MRRLALTVFTAEFIKIRRTFALWLAVIVPLFAVAVFAAHLSERESSFGMSWFQIRRAGFGPWLTFFLPALIFFETAFLASLEQEGNQWKQLLALPVPRPMYFATMMAMCALIVGASSLLFAAGLAAAAVAIGDLRGLSLQPSIVWSESFQLIGQAFLASWLIIVIQTWLSIRLPGFVKAMGIGILALILGGMLSGVGGIAGRLLKKFVLWWYPWILPLRINDIGPDTSPIHAAYAATVGCLGGILMGALACWDLARNDEHELQRS